MELLSAYGVSGYPGEGSLPEVREAVRVAGQLGDVRLLGRSRLALAQVLWIHERENRAALELTEAVLADDPTHWRALAFRGRLLLETDRLDDAQAALDRAGELLPRSSSVARWLELEPRYAMLDLARGLLQSAEGKIGRFLELCQEQERPFGVAQGLLILGECCVYSGRYGEAIDIFERALDQIQSFNVSIFLENIVLAGLVVAYAGAGEKDRARELLEVWRAHPSPSPRSRTHGARAMIELAEPDDLDEAEAYLDGAERAASDAGVHYWRARYLECRAALARRRGDEEGRLNHLREAQRLYTEMGATGHAERVARELSS